MFAYFDAHPWIPMYGLLFCFAWFALRIWWKFLKWLNS